MQVIKTGCGNCGGTVKYYPESNTVYCLTCFTHERLPVLSGKAKKKLYDSLETVNDATDSRLSRTGSYLLYKCPGFIKAITLLDKASKEGPLSSDEEAILLKFGFYENYGEDV